jgi:hypothetical protein
MNVELSKSDKDTQARNKGENQGTTGSMRGV